MLPRWLGRQTLRCPRAETLVVSPGQAAGSRPRPPGSPAELPSGCMAARQDCHCCRGPTRNVQNHLQFLSARSCLKTPPFLKIHASVVKAQTDRLPVREALQQHLLGRHFLRRREAVPQDVAQVEPAGRAHEDGQHVHLGRGGEPGRSGKSSFRCRVKKSSPSPLEGAEPGAAWLVCHRRLSLSSSQK